MARKGYKTIPVPDATHDKLAKLAEEHYSTIPRMIQYLIDLDEKTRREAKKKRKAAVVKANE